VIYEMHVRGFTRHPNSGVAEEKRGTYAGLIEKIPYLKELGITAVELLPVFQFDPQDSPRAGQLLGVQPGFLFAPHQGYSSRKDALGVLDEFRDMVKPFTARVSKSSSMSCIIIRPKGSPGTDLLFQRTPERCLLPS